MTILRSSILKTLAYADVFSFPLTQEEVHYWLISRPKDDQPLADNIKKELTYLIKMKKVFKKNAYYAFSKETVFTNRKERLKYSMEKKKKAKAAASILGQIPGILLIGISGAVAINNADSHDDIDFYIICRKGTLWTTRFLTVLVTELLGTRRRPDERYVSNMICLNMFVEEDHCAIMSSQRTLFTAHEVLQMQPIFEREEMFQRFLQANTWAGKYCRNAFLRKSQIGKTEKNILANFFIMICQMVEPLLKHFQLWYMKKRRTNEVIEKGVIRFHPRDAQEWVMGIYDTKVSSL